MKIVSAFSKKIEQLPLANTQLLASLDFAFGPSYEIVISGNSQANDTRKMLEAIRRPFIPNKIIILRPTEQESPDIDQIVPFAEYYASIEGKATIYICVNYSCKTPTTELDEVIEILNSG